MGLLDSLDLIADDTRENRLTRSMSKGIGQISVSVNEIRPNSENFYSHVCTEEDEQIYVEDLAKMILEHGQDAPCIVYEDTDIDDGRKYTLIAGERRWKAITLNMDRQLSDGLCLIRIIPKPDNMIEERLRLIENNAQRNKDKAMRTKEIETLSQVWEALKEQGQQPRGKKRDWIASKIGLSPRTIQNYLPKESEPIDAEVPCTDAEEQVQQSNNGLTSSDLEYLKQVEKNMSESLGRKVKISKKCAITIQPNGLEDIFTVLSDLGFDENGYMQ